MNGGSAGATGAFGGEEAGADSAESALEQGGAGSLEGVVLIFVQG